MLVVAILIGALWVTNIVRLTQLDFEAPYKAEVIRSIGVVIVPVGAVLGLVDIADGDTNRNK
jgi:hypothetical protein